MQNFQGTLCHKKGLLCSKLCNFFKFHLISLGLRGAQPICANEQLPNTENCMYMYMYSSIETLTCKTTRRMPVYLFVHLFVK